MNTTTFCPVEALANEAKKLADEHLRIEAEFDAKRIPLEIADKEGGRLTSILREIEDAAACLPARSPKGVLLQLVITDGKIAVLEASVPLDEAAYYKHLASCRKLMSSLIGFMEREHGIDRDDVGGDHYSPH